MKGRDGGKKQERRWMGRHRKGEKKRYRHLLPLDHRFEKVRDEARTLTAIYLLPKQLQEDDGRKEDQV